MKIRQTYQLTDQFVAFVKEITVRCNKYRDLIEFVGKPPSVVVTRWNTWLECAIWYYSNYSGVNNFLGKN
ncbi:hypothetical protein ECANGB1_1361 [Enterospora canceri]|uniref:Uncharacterized protein n=1 Tax=Enterospora canceri TaxID=1081671 RepID=A0A1Y1S673_9MICR|nr:hypothetical protein ECANGB1_1361 [Enterospora canceri]